LGANPPAACSRGFFCAWRCQVKHCRDCRRSYHEAMTTQGIVWKCKLGLNRKLDGHLDPIQDIAHRCKAYSPPPTMRTFAKRALPYWSRLAGPRLTQRIYDGLRLRGL